MADAIQFYLDEHVNPAVAEGLRRLGIDVLTVREAGLLGADDREHLARAAKGDRVVFTQDADFLRLHVDGVFHKGIIYTRQGIPIGDILRGLKLIYDILSAEEMIGKVEFL